MASASYIAQSWRSRARALAPSAVIGLLVVLLAMRAALFVGSLASAPIGDSDSPVAPLSPGQDHSVVDLPSILQANLFGQSPPAGGGVQVTSMPLQLTGVIAHADEKRGFAMLGTSATDVQLYRVGDALPGGARLHAVHVDRILLDRSGAIEALLIPQYASVLGVNPQAPPPAVAEAPRPRVQRPERTPGVLGEVMQSTPVLSGGRMRGMRVTPHINAEAFNRFGLRPGDVITAVNGVPLDDQARSAEIFNTLNSTAAAQVTVERNGRLQELSLNLAEVSDKAD